MFLDKLRLKFYKLLGNYFMQSVIGLTLLSAYEQSVCNFELLGIYLENILNTIFLCFIY